MTETPTKREAIAEVRQLYAAMQRFDLLASKALGVNLTDLRCINILRDGQLTPGEIGTLLGLTSGSVTALVDRLERLGAVQRTRQSDRRSVGILLRSKFRDKARKVYGELGDSISRQLENRDLQQDDFLKECLEALVAGVDDATQAVSAMRVNTKTAERARSVKAREA